MAGSSSKVKKGLGYYRDAPPRVPHEAVSSARISQMAVEFMERSDGMSLRADVTAWCMLQLEDEFTTEAKRGICLKIVRKVLVGLLSEGKFVAAFSSKCNDYVVGLVSDEAAHEEILDLQRSNAPE